ncbi:MAG: copper-binding protein [Magnetococcales bacterium]|nr:copper-binding protein [Magnetococcales bacterium]
MRHTNFFILFLALTISYFNPGESWASSHGHMDHGNHNMSDHSMEMPAKSNHGSAMGIINKIDSKNRLINVTHGPIPSLGWPEMTMDLAVTKRVKINNFKNGDHVHFTVKKGRDNRFRITKMMPSK